MSADSELLLEARDLVREFRLGSAVTTAGRASIRPVDGVSLEVRRGETVGLVGESGSGKSTLGRTLIMIEPPTSGALRFAGEDITRLRGRRLRQVRSDLQMIFQDPYASLNPRWRAEDIVAEGLALQTRLDRRARQRRVAEVLDRVGLPASAATKYPHEFSGGQRQRLGIARALVVEPKLIVADESVSALDVSVQSKIINLLQELKAQLGLTYVFISHDLAVVRYVSDRVAVMYLGQIVELASADDVYARPLHPYTLSLLSASPQARRTDVAPARERVLLRSDPPSLTRLPSGCRFRSRCPFAQPGRCAAEAPRLRVLTGGHAVACHFAEEIAAGRIAPRDDATGLATPAR
ncbi:ABC transporter ATP-binding protein [Micromonospora olivasterospora]|uniref:Peptide/nickel transport system ATP-binding protein n=1 Tax=Micromonospora olivasterospora TaxID=1880 RepID=A0A562IHV2_MICOL|nr:oligopeptide/dipeptide ABC transporter ATP-binding protein [Micromonospora olivasterospora]TWH70597.1 peptide/nickel transport system ATP-binding protein [Micromonospora olivasterospora]